MRDDLKTNELATLEDLETLVHDVYKYGWAPISQVKLSGFDEAIKATLAWIGLMRGRDAELLRTCVGDRPLVEAQRNEVTGAIYSRQIAENVYVFTDNDGFDQLKSTLYYMLLNRLHYIN